MKFHSLLFIFLFTPSLADAQLARAPDLVISYSALERGDLNDAKTWSVVSFGAGWRVSPVFSVQASADYAAEAGVIPGFFLAGLGVRAEIPRRSKIYPFIEASWRVGRFNADEHVRIREKCHAIDGCMFEAVGYYTGNWQAKSAHVGVAARAFDQGSVELYYRINARTKGPGGNDYSLNRFNGFGASIAWRP